MSKKKKIKNEPKVTVARPKPGELPSEPIYIGMCKEGTFYYWGPIDKADDVYEKAKEKKFQRSKKDKWGLITKCRNSFADCLFNDEGFGSFKGEVLISNRDKSHIIFKRLFIEYGVLDVYEGKEDHVILLDEGEAFKDIKLKPGMNVSFLGEVYPYQRRNGTVDFGIKNVSCVEVINEDYQLPSDEDLLRQEIERFVCSEDMCTFYEHCNGLYCLQPEGYREEMVNRLIAFHKARTEKTTV